MADQKTVPCQICGEVKQQNEVVPAELIPASIIDLMNIRRGRPQGISVTLTSTGSEQRMSGMFLRRRKTSIPRLKWMSEMMPEQRTTCQKISMSNLKRS
jgi:hypothetical protein